MISSLALAAALLAAPAAPPAAPPTVVITRVAPARPPSEKALAYLKTIRFDETMDRVFADMTPLFGLQAVTSLEANPKTRAFASELFEKLPGGRPRFAQMAGEEFARELRKTYPEVDAAYASAIDSNFTPAELDELNRFFASGTGAKYLASQAPMQAELQGFLRTIGMRAGSAAGIAAVERAAREAGLKPVDRSS